MKTACRVVVSAALAIFGAGAATGSAQTTLIGSAAGALESAHHLFYNGRFDEAATLALAVRTADRHNLAASELRSSALHFQIKRLFGNPNDKDRAWKQCYACQELMSEFLAETNLGRAEARSRLKAYSGDEEALFFLGKLHLNYIWLQLGTLGRRAGWSEYWEARKSLDAVLKRNPSHVRARIARAWIDYIVDTRAPRGTKWLLGGGSKTRGLQAVLDATHADAPPYVQAEAMFALWDMQVRERNLPDAVMTARALARDFPDNRELTKFLSTHDLQGSR